MNSTVNITIVTPSYNQGAFLAETIESVMSQRGDFSIEYIIVDGGSTDDSIKIIRHYEWLLEQGMWNVQCLGINYRWLSEKDRGQANALMKGFRMAGGDIYAWLNSDDIYLPGALQSVADFFQALPDTGLFYGEAHYCAPDGKIIGSYRTNVFYFEKLAWFNFICQPAAFFSKVAFETVGGLDESLQYAMDYDLWIRLGKRFPCRYRTGPLAAYRLHEASKTISDKNLIENAEEGLYVAMKHFGWAPITRVYNACYPLSMSRLPSCLARYRMVVTISALLLSIFRSFRLNHGINKKDLKLLNCENFRKLFRSRLKIMTCTNGNLYAGKDDPSQSRFGK